MDIQNQKSLLKVLEDYALGNLESIAQTLNTHKDLNNIETSILGGCITETIKLLRAISDTPVEKEQQS